MATLYIGRLGLDVSQDTFDTFDPTADRVSVSGQFIGTTLKELQGLRQNWLGMDGRVEPVYWSEDDWSGGFYRVTNPQVKHHPVSLVTFSADWSGTLERIPHSQAAITQLQSFGQNRASATGTPQSWIAMQSSARSQLLTGSVNNASENRSGPGPLGTSDSVQLFIATSTGLYDSYNFSYVKPQDFYDMGVFFIADGRVVNGTNGEPAIANMTDWVLTNGIVKIEPGSTAIRFKITCPRKSPNEASWSAATTEWSPQFYNAAWADISTIETFAVLVNEAHEVTVRFVATFSTPNLNRMFIDLMLRRGSRTVEMKLSKYDATFGLGIVAHDSVTWTVTGAPAQTLWWDTDDATDGCRYAMISPLTLAAGSKRIGTTSGVTEAQFGLCGVTAGSGATGNNTVAELRDQYNAFMRETLSMVSP